MSIAKEKGIRNGIGGIISWGKFKGGICKKIITVIRTISIHLMPITKMLVTPEFHDELPNKIPMAQFYQ